MIWLISHLKGTIKKSVEKAKSQHLVQQPSSNSPRSQTPTSFPHKAEQQEELVETLNPYPHTQDELEIASTVRNLSLEDCRHLFDLIRRASTETARAAVCHYLKNK